MLAGPADVGVIYAILDRVRKTGAVGEDAADLPVAEPAVTLAQRRLPQHRRDIAVLLMKIRQGPRGLQVIGILREVLVPRVGSDGAAVVDGFGERVADQRRETVGEPPLEFGRQGMVVRADHAVRHLNDTQLGERPPGLHIAGPRRGEVEGPESLELVPLVAGVADLHHGVLGQFTLYVEEVLHHVRRAPVVVVGKDQRKVHHHRAQAGEGGVQGQVRKIAVGGVVPARGQVAGHIVPRIADVLRVEHAGAAADGPVPSRAVGQAQARREVVVVAPDQAVAQPAVAGNLHVRGVAEGHVLVEVARAGAHHGRAAGRIERRK